MRKLMFSGLIVFLGIWAFPGDAVAAPVSCPDPSVTDWLQFHAEGTGTTTVEECVYGNGNLNDVTDIGSAFGGTLDPWTSFCSTGNADQSNTTNGCYTDYGFTFTNGTFSFTGDAGSEYAIGIKDGTAPGNPEGSPEWAIFLLSNTDVVGDVLYTGTWDITLNDVTNYGRLSHFVIFDRDVETTTSTTPSTTPSTNTTPSTTNTPSGVAPEPTVMTLLGAGLILASRRFRRRNNG